MKLILSIFSALIFFAARAQTVETPFIDGKWIHIFNPNDTRSAEDTTWYTNDHCFVKANDGSWHAYGIIGHKPIDPWKGETRLFHISSKTITQEKWSDHDYALTTLPGIERVLWAPHVITENGTYYMFYNIGNMQNNAPENPSWGQLCLATSKDLFNWTRHERNPLFSDPGHARDSYITKIKGQYYYYYTRIFNEVDERSSVAVRTGTDLTHWSGPRIAHVQPLKNYYGGDAESSFVIQRNDVFYLFICRANTDYNRTDVYWSKDNQNFPEKNFITQLPVHAAEIIQEGSNWYISNTGWDKKGLFIASLFWKK